MRKLPDVELLRKFFSYNPETGEITRLWLDSVPFEDVTEWGRAISNGRCAGKICERIDKFGYVKVTVGRRVFPAHRVAYAVYHGYDPWPMLIDHINGNPADNRIENLRICDEVINGKNSKRSKRNTSGETGVIWCKRSKRWRVRITVGGKVRSFGSYDSFDQAVARRRSLALEYGYHPNHGRH